MHVRPLTQEDVAAADDVARDALHRPDPGADLAAVARGGRRRIAHLQQTDPDGCFVAEGDAGQVVGVSISLIREGVWGYSLFAVSEHVHGRGLGRALFDAAWDYGRAAGAHIILSSAHPAAMRLYGLTGLPLLPCVAAAGIADLSRAPDLARVRDAGSAELGLVDELGRELRGAAHGVDLPVLLEVGTRLVVVEDRAFAFFRGTRLILAGGRDDQSAALALWGAFARMGRGATVTVDFLTAGQDWAVQACLTAGLALSPDGPMFAGGELGPMRPYLPSGAYL
ncbi:MAG: GNAT family N-acetyltransferase [Solirubrobacteraceae bacterium]